MIDYQTISIVLTGVGLIIALTYYGLQIRNQNRTRQVQIFLQLYNNWRGDTKGLTVDKFFNTKLSGLDEYLEKVESDESFRSLVDAHWAFYESLGVIVKSGYIDIHLIALMWSGITRSFYENIVEPIIEEAKVYYDMPRIWSETVYVCKELLKYVEEHPELKT